MKITVRQIPVEWQSFIPIENWGLEGNFAIEGNKKLSSFCHSEVFQKVKGTLEDGEIFEALYSMEAEGACCWLPYTKYSFQVIQEYLPKENGKRYSIKELFALKKALSDWAMDYDDEYFVSILSIVTSKKWDKATIRGYRQSDWNNIFYVKNEVSKESVESAYFGEYSEWVIEEVEAEDEIYNIKGIVFIVPNYLDIEECLSKGIGCIIGKECEKNMDFLPCY